MHLTQVTPTGSMDAEWKITPRTLQEFEARFSTEEGCREYLFQLRWPEGFRCPRCFRPRHPVTCDPMKALGYVRVSTDQQVERSVSLEAHAEKIRAMAVVHNTALAEIIVDGGESAKSLNRPGMARLLAMVDAGKVETVIIAKLDRLTRSVKDCARCWSGSSGGAWRWRVPSRRTRLLLLRDALPAHITMASLRIRARRYRSDPLASPFL